MLLKELRSGGETFYAQRTLPEDLITASQVVLHDGVELHDLPLDVSAGLLRRCLALQVGERKLQRYL